MNRRQTYGMGMHNKARNNNHNGRYSMAMNPRANVLQNNMKMKNMRRSSLMMNSKKISKDPRPLKDSKWKEEHISKLIEYLCNHGYDSSMLSPKELNPPSTKNFQYICCFLFQQIDPSFNIKSKFEDSVIAFFDKVGYPFKINKSSIRCIAPHAWAPLLGAISWLIELLMFAESFDDDDKVENVENIENDVENVESDKIDRFFFNLVAENYGSWLRGDDDDDGITAQLMKPFEDKISYLNDNIASFDTANKQLMTECKRLENECPKISSLQDQRQKTITAVAEMNKIIEETDGYIEVVKTKHRDWSNNVNEKMVKITASDDKIKELNDILSKQTISTKEVQRMHCESESLHSETDQLQIQKEEIIRKQYDLNENINDVIKKIKMNIKNYNYLAEKIEIIPQNAKYSFGQNHTLKLNDDINTSLVIKKMTDICNQDIDNFANNLNQLNNHYHDKIRKTKSIIKSENDKIAQIKSNLMIKQNEIDILNQRLSNIVNLFHEEKSKMSLLTANTAANIEKIELDINCQSHEIDQELKNKKKEFERITNEYNKKQEECKTIEIQITSKCAIAIKKLLKHRQNIRKTIKDVNKRLDDALEKTSFYHIQEPTIHNIQDIQNDDDNKENDQDIEMQNN